MHYCIAAVHADASLAQAHVFVAWLVVVLVLTAHAAARDSDDSDPRDAAVKLARSAGADTGESRAVALKGLGDFLTNFIKVVVTSPLALF
ncbi:hypothetical protein evm_014086 [Chilo suppressalis]|nr:hypothetical protein evm_014086 [Chilo suppressalis]